VGQPGLSFQTNLERYLDLARAAGAIPVLLTPTARVLDENKKPGVPAMPSHVTQSDPKKAVLFVGDYAQTVRDTAKANHVPLIEIEEASRSFVNRVGDPAWKDYYLVVDPATYPYYRNHPQGTPDKPDSTHFQARGAEAIADMVVAGIKGHPGLTHLASLLK
jgi:lysophospholipase L1-like esterase